MDKCACKGAYLSKLLQPAILVTLDKTPTHGFHLLTLLTKSGLLPGNSLDSAGLYRTLEKLSERKLISEQWDMDSGKNPRRVYTLTEEGKHCLVNWHATLTQYKQTLDLLLQETSTCTAVQEQSPRSGAESHRLVAVKKQTTRKGTIR